MTEKEKRIQTIRRMLEEISYETEYPNGFNEVSQIYEELLMPLIPKKAHEVIMQRIEEASCLGVNRRKPVVKPYRLWEA